MSNMKKNRCITERIRRTIMWPRSAAETLESLQLVHRDDVVRSREMWQRGAREPRGVRTVSPITVCRRRRPLPMQVRKKTTKVRSHSQWRGDRELTLADAVSPGFHNELSTNASHSHHFGSVLGSLSIHRHKNSLNLPTSYLTHANF